MKPTYVWDGVNAQGRPARGELAAASARHAQALLRRQGVRARNLKRKRRGFALPSRATAADIALFSRQLANLTRAGVHLVQALRIVADSARNAAFATIVRGIGGELAAGSALAQALATRPREFDEVYRHLVSVGEQSGALDAMLERIANYQEHAQATRRKVRKALVYPTVVVVVAALVTTLLLIHIVPQFETVFASAGAELPAFTRFVIGLSNVLGAWWPALLLGAVGGALAFALALRRSPRCRAGAQRFALNIPMIGRILRKAAVGRCARTLATAVAAGVPLVEAFRAVAGATGNPVFANALRQAGEDVAAGRAVAAALADAPPFPALLTQLVAVGEESGNLDNMLAKCADIYEADVADAVDNLTTLVEPLLMGVLGVVVGGLIVAMYLPVFQLGSVFAS